MTVSVPGDLIRTYAGDGSTTAFSYPVRFDADDELVVILRDSDGNDTVKALGTDYTASGEGNDAGGTVTFTSAPASGVTVVIYRATEETQVVDLENASRNDAGAVELQLDRMVRMIQDHSAELGRSVKSRPGSSGPALPESQDGSPLVWDGSSLANGPSPEDGRLLGWHNGRLVNRDVIVLPNAPAGTTGLDVLAAETADDVKAIIDIVSVKADLMTALSAGRAVQVTEALTAITLDTTSEVQTVLSALDKINVLGSSLAINLPTGQHSITSASPVRSRKINIAGASPVETTITSIASVVGSSGNWSVTANVADATGISVGDVLKITGVTPGVQAPGLNSGQPVRGALQLQFFQLGTLSTSGTAWSISGSGLETYIASGDMVIADGRVRRITAVSDTGFTTTAPAKDFSGKQYWYTMKTSGGGLVTISGTTATCSGSFFTTRANPGDILCVAGYGMRKIASIESATQLTLEQGGMDVPSNSYWGVITPGENHEGAWEVTAVSGNQITWTNTARTTFAPPVNNINGGTIKALKTVLSFSGTNGFDVDDCLFEIDNVGLKGAGGSATVAFDLRGTGTGRSGQAKLGTNVAVSGFHYGSRVSTGGSLYAVGTAWGGQTTRGHDLSEGGSANLSDAAIVGSGGVGVFIGAGCYCRLASARVQANSLQGVRIEVGGSTWADFSIVGYNNGANILVVGGCEYHFVGCKSFGGASHGLNGQNGGYGRFSGFIGLCNGSDGINIASGKSEGTQSILIGNGRYGAYGLRADYSIGSGAIAYNVDQGIYALKSSKIQTDSASILGHGTGIVASGLSEVNAEAAGFADNTTDGSATGRSLIWVKDQSGGSNWSPTLNSVATDGSLITNGS